MTDRRKPHLTPDDAAFVISKINEGLGILAHTGYCGAVVVKVHYAPGRRLQIDANLGDLDLKSAQPEAKTLTSDDR